MLNSVAGTGPTVVAGCPTTVFKAGALKSVSPVLPKKVPVQPGGEVVPRKRLIPGTVPVDLILQGQAVLFQGQGPQLRVEVFAPLLEDTTVGPYIFDDRAETAVAPTEKPLNDRRSGIVPLQSNTLEVPCLVAEKAHLAS